MTGGYQICPVCNGVTDGDEVDVGVGIIYGPRSCRDCGWDEDAGPHVLIDEADATYGNDLRYIIDHSYPLGYPVSDSDARSNT